MFIFRFRARLILVVLFSGVNLLGVLSAQNSEIPVEWTKVFASARSFEELFELDVEIPLSDSIPIGGQYDFEVGSDHRLLLTDKLHHSVLLFSSSGKLLRVLSSENVSPGLHWYPSAAGFTGDDHIIVNLNVEGLFLFDSSGICLSKIDIPGLHPNSFYADAHWNLYGYNLHHDEFYISKADIQSQQMIKFGSLNEEFREMIGRMPVPANIVADDHGNIYVVHISGSKIYKYSRAGEFMATFAGQPGYYREPKEDFPSMNTDPMAFVKKMTPILNSFTHTRGIYLFSPEILLILYFDPGKSVFGLDLCTTEGEYLLKNDITMQLGSLAFAAKRGFIYDGFQPEMSEDGYVRNPVVRRYMIRIEE